MPEYHSPREIAQRWGVSPLAVRRLLRANRIPGAKQIGGKGGAWIIPVGAERIGGTRGPASREQPDRPRNTLHQAIITVIDLDDVSLDADIARKISERNLWRRKVDGQYPEAWQVLWRAKKYPLIFRVEGHNIRKR